MLGLGEIIPLEVDTNKVGPVRATKVVVSPKNRSLVTDTIVVALFGSLILSVCTVILCSVKFSVVSGFNIEIPVVSLEVFVMVEFGRRASIRVSNVELKKKSVFGLVSKVVSSLIVSKVRVVSGLVSKFSKKVVFT